MIDLERFTRPVNVIVPIRDGQFVYRRKPYRAAQVEDGREGWYRVQLTGNKVEILQAVCLELEAHPYSALKGYTCGKNFLFQNFTAGLHKTGSKVLCPLCFNSQPTFTAVEAVYWEDGRLYYYRPVYTDSLIFAVKDLYESGGDCGRGLQDLKGVTPELKTLYLFHDLERRQQDAKLKAGECALWENSLKERLSFAFNQVGAQLLQCIPQGTRLVVDWVLQGRRFNSLLNTETLQVMEAGFCMSGDDKRHSVASMVLTAKDYEENHAIYITRE